MKDYLLKLAKADLANADDNLFRAKSSARGCDPGSEYGRSGQTLNEIIGGYQTWHDRAERAIAWLEARP